MLTSSHFRHQAACLACCLLDAPRFLVDVVALFAFFAELLTSLQERVPVPMVSEPLPRPKSMELTNILPALQQADDTFTGATLQALSWKAVVFYGLLRMATFNRQELVTLQDDSGPSGRKLCHGEFSCGGINLNQPNEQSRLSVLR